VKRARFLLLASLLSAGALYVGLRVGSLQPATPVHPLTGRPIAGIATDAAWMDRASRAQEESPDRALSLVGLQRGMTVADVGAGSGYMTLRIAAIVGPTGKVYAEDIQPRLLAIVGDKARTQGLANVETVLGSDTDARLQDGAIDVALLVDVYHEFRHPQEMLRSIRRALKPGGRLVLIEYRKEDASLPIAPTHRMSLVETRTEIEAEGFTFDRSVETLPRQHIVIFKK
jgi:predicted methyltransferase